MIKLDRISLKQYCELEDRSEYDFAMQYAFCFTEPVDEYGVGDLTEQSFGFIKDFQYSIEQGLSFDELIKTISDLSKVKDIGSEPIDKFIRFSNYLKESIRQIIEVENQLLSHEPDADEEAAGMDRFDRLGIYLQIRSLTGGDITKHEKVKSLPYSLCLTEMYTAKQMNDYERELIRIKQNKH